MMQLKYEPLTSQAYLKSIFFLSFSLTISPLNGPNNDPCLTSAVHQAPTERQDVCLYTGICKNAGHVFFLQCHYSNTSMNQRRKVFHSLNKP